MAALFGGAASSSAANNAQGDNSKDIAITSPPEDSISEISFSQKSDHLAVASWDKKVRIYEINNQGQSEGKAVIEHEGPVLACCWSDDGTKVVSAGADRAARMLDVSSNTTTQVAAHDQPIRCIKFIESGGASILVTGSWDKTIKYWDLRQPTPVASLECQERIYTMDAKKNLLVVGTADRYINIIELGNPGKFFKTLQSPLKWQTRVVTCLNDATGFAVGSIEGRCAFQYIDDKDLSANFSFKCHRQPPPNTRDQSNVYSVNAISIHPTHGTFSTAGSDGTFHFWDKDAKHRLKGYPEVGGAITSTCFNGAGTIFAYSVTYDWSKGYAFHTPQSVNKVMLHAIGPDECKPRPKAVTKR